MHKNKKNYVSAVHLVIDNCWKKTKAIGAEQPLPHARWFDLDYCCYLLNNQYQINVNFSLKSYPTTKSVPIYSSSLYFLYLLVTASHDYFTRLEWIIMNSQVKWCGEVTFKLCKSIQIHINTLYLFHLWSPDCPENWCKLIEWNVSCFSFSILKKISLW